jgi:hypothetical protein
MVANHSMQNQTIYYHVLPIVFMNCHMALACGLKVEVKIGFSRIIVAE